MCITQYAHVYPLFLGRLCVVAIRIEFTWKHLRNNLATAAAATPPHTHTHTPVLAPFDTCAVFVGTNVAKSLTDTEIQWQLQIHPSTTHNHRTGAPAKSFHNENQYLLATQGT